MLSSDTINTILTQKCKKEGPVWTSNKDGGEE
jgi:hypothetical protein